MFTGIIEDLGKIVSKEIKNNSIKFEVSPKRISFIDNLNIGDSIAVNGACMTVEDIKDKSFSFTTIKESLKKTNLENLNSDDFVNIEKPLRINSKLDGHIVQGHIDTTGIVRKIQKQGDSWEFFIEFSENYYENVIYVGSIAINGVSLTIAEIIDDPKSITIKVAIIPHTYSNTTFQYVKKNDIVNLEFDMLGKYVKRIISKK